MSKTDCSELSSIRSLNRLHRLINHEIYNSISCQPSDNCGKHSNQNTSFHTV